MGGRKALEGCSLLEAIALCEHASGNKVSVTYGAEARKGDHVWWISDVGKFARAYPGWSYGHDLASIVADVYEGARLAAAASRAR